MLERFLEQTHFTSQEDFIKNFKIKVPENFNFGYDVVDAWAEERPEKKALLWTNDKGTKAITKTKIPIPPSQCEKLRQNKLA